MFLYHIKRDNFRGNILYPLNKLKEIHPDAHEYAVNKYSYRPDLMDVFFPLANCKWNDVVHLCPVDIGEIIRAMVKIFKDCDKIDILVMERAKALKYYKIDSDSLNHDNLFIYFKYKSLGDSIKYVQEDVRSNMSTWKDGMKKLDTRITPGQIEYFKECVRDLSKPRYLFTTIPHVLYKGEINIKHTEIKEVCL